MQLLGRGFVYSGIMSELRNQDPQQNEEAAGPVEAPQTETADAPPADADDSLFCPQCGAKMGAGDVFCGACGRRLGQAADPAAAGGGRIAANPSGLNRLTALLLCLLLGFLGIHRFYAGKIGTGLLFLITGGFLFVGVIYDCVMIATGEFTDAEGRKLLYRQ